MNLKFESVLLIFGGLLRIIATGASLWYFLTKKSIQTCSTTYAEALSLPILVFMSITIVLAIIDICRFRCSELLYKLDFGLFITIGSPLGIPLFVYAAILALNPSQTGDFFIIEGLSRSATLVEAMFESLPQIAIQVFNNQLLGEWGTFKYFSISISSLGIICSLYKLCYAIDKIEQYEYATEETNKIQVKLNQVIDVKKNSIEKENSIEKKNSNEFQIEVLMIY